MLNDPRGRLALTPHCRSCLSMCFAEGKKKIVDFKQRVTEGKYKDQIDSLASEVNSFAIEFKMPGYNIV